MVTAGEILRWFIYTVSRWYYRLGARLMRRDELLLGSERKFRALLEAAPDAMVIVDAHGHISLVNAQAERLFGYRREQLIGQGIGELIPERFRAAHREHRRSYVRDAGTRPMGVGLELFGRRSDGTEFPVEISLSPLETADGQVVMAAIRDITERREAEARLRHLADHDGLTELLNRRCFEEHLTREVAIAGRHEVAGALVLIDIDGLKDLNDTLGHQHGDELLRRVAVLLRRRLRGTDIVARLGGDEFAVLLPHTTCEQATEVAVQLLDAIREDALVVGSQRVRTTCSAGIATYGHPGITREDVLVTADIALYEAKDSGRDRVVVHVAGEAERAEREVRATWSRRLRHVLDERLLVPHRQPILHTGSREIVEYELLVRVLDDKGRAVAPGAFMPTAERTGMILEIDRFMVEQAVELIASSAAHDPVPMAYAVNLSARSLADGTLPAHIAGCVDASGIDPSRLVFELTETAAIANMDAACLFADALRSLGCQLALDDFGAGFASFFHLKHLPLDRLKIDGAYVRNIGTSDTDRRIVSHMARIAHDFGLQTCAEFVQNQEHLDIVAGFGVERAQGYYIGRPEPVPGQELRLAMPPETPSRDEQPA